MINLIHSSSTSATAKVLHDMLVNKRNQEPFHSKYIDGIMSGKSPITECELLINWGGRTKNFSMPFTYKYCLNHFALVERNTLKRRIIEYAEKLDIPVPLVITAKEAMDALKTGVFVDLHGREYKLNELFPLVMRKAYHSRGRDAVMINTKEELEAGIATNSVYFVKYIPKIREYRVHMVRKGFKYPPDDPESYKVLFMQRKAPAPDEEEYDEYIWSHERGWNLNKVTKVTRFYRKAEKVAKDVMSKVLFLDFAAIDIIFDEDENPYFLEANSGPGLSEDNAKYYVDYFWDMWKYVRDHKDMEEEDEEERSTV